METMCRKKVTLFVLIVSSAVFLLPECLGYPLDTDLVSEAAGLTTSSVDKREAEEPQQYFAPEDYENTVIHGNKKRAALLMDRLMYALKQAIDEEDEEESYEPIPVAERVVGGAPPQVDLQRRGQHDGPLYWRCYFNAVSCFKKK